MRKLVLLRHGESEWNRENRFTGWTDVDLSPAGIAEARAGGRQLKADGRLIAAGPMDPRYGGIFLLKVSDDDPQRALDAIRDGDPFYQQHIAQYELLCKGCRLGYPVRDDIPVMLEEEARKLPAEEEI